MKNNGVDIVVIAGNKQEFDDFAKNNNFKDRRLVYAYAPEAVAGYVDYTLPTVVRIGTYKERDDLEAIEQTIQSWMVFNNEE